MTKTKTLLFNVALAAALSGCSNQADSSAANTAGPVKMEVGCGMCIYDQDGVNGCETWVKVGDDVYPLDGAELDAHSTGLCSAAAHANVKGEVKEGLFVAESIALIAEGDHSGHGHDHSGHKH